MRYTDRTLKNEESDVLYLGLIMSFMQMHSALLEFHIMIL